MSNNDPRPHWDAKEPELATRTADFLTYEKVAGQLGNQPSIDRVAASFAELRGAVADYREKRGHLDAAADVRKAADEKLAKARQAVEIGTPDAKQALRNHEAAVVAEAALRHCTHPLAELFSSTAAARDRLQNVAFVAVDRDVMTETRDFASRVLQNGSPNSALEAAKEAGTKSNAARAAWWLVAESIVRDEYKAALAGRKKEVARQMGTYGDASNGRDHRREEPYMPSEDMLEQCFARRRGAFEAERRRVEAQIRELNGQLDNFGGAA